MNGDSNAYDSQNDSGEDLFNVPKEMPSSPSQPTQASQQPASSYITQPTQPLPAPQKLTPHRDFSQSPSPPRIQVPASSPIQQPAGQALSPSSQSQDRGISRAGFLANAMAPPGTSFRPPSQRDSQRDSQPYIMTQTQTQGMSQQSLREHSPLEEPRVRENPNDIKKSVFSRGGQPITSPGRVEESPQKRFRDHVQGYQYGAGSVSPQKRAAPPDDLASAYGQSSRPAKAPRQTGPERTLPVPPATLDEIDDFAMREKVENLMIVFPHKSLAELFRALNMKRGNYSDALAYFAEQAIDEETNGRGSPHDFSADELSLSAMKPSTKRDIGRSRAIAQKWPSNQGQTNAPVAPMAPMATMSPVRDVKQHIGRSMSMQEKYATSQGAPAAAPAPDGERRRKLIKGRRTRSPSPPASLSKPQKTQHSEVPANAKVHVIESDDESDGDSGVEVKEEPAAPELESKLLEFMNTCTPAALIDLCSQPADVVEFVLTKRPFKTLDHVREVTMEVKSTTKTGKTKTTRKQVGDKLMDVCLEIWTGYDAIDQLVAKCEVMGKTIATEMKAMGINAFGAAGKGELEITDLSDASHDSGIGTPSSSASVVDDDDLKKQKRRAKPLLKQPRTMSESLTMKDYQIAGLNWLALLYSQRMSCILADDMGLGKTCQVISFLAHLVENDISRGVHLVIVPGSTLENWMRECANFCPSLQVELYYGLQKDRLEMQERLIEKMNANKVNVIITTYDMATKPDDAKFLRKKVQPVVCVFDEGHALKNSQSQRYKSLMRIPAQFRLLLTGTPLQNNLSELISLLAFIMPQVFEERQEDLQAIFKHRARLEADIQSSSEREKLLSAERVNRARSMMTPFVLRRKKHQVLKSLPPKTSHVEYCEMPTHQQTLYDECAAQARNVLGASTDAKARSNVLMDLRKAAIHPLLFRRHYTDAILHKMAARYVKYHPESTEELVFEDFTVMTDFELHNFCIDPRHTQHFATFALRHEPWLASAKVSALLAILRDHAANGHRTLIFSQFTMVMNILEAVFQSAGLPFYRLDGGTRMEQRQDLLDSFHNDEETRIFMLSTKAGGQGVNLACADRVIIFDAGFNPHEDVQAENRAHRVGQTKPVEVVRLVTRGTIEESILALGDSKLVLDSRVAGAGEGEDPARAETAGQGLVEQMMQRRLKDAPAPAQASTAVAADLPESLIVADDDDDDDEDMSSDLSDAPDAEPQLPASSSLADKGKKTRAAQTKGRTPAAAKTAKKKEQAPKTKTNKGAARAGHNSSPADTPSKNAASGPKGKEPKVKRDAVQKPAKTTATTTATAPRAKKAAAKNGPKSLDIGDLFRRGMAEKGVKVKEV